MSILIHWVFTMLALVFLLAPDSAIIGDTKFERVVIRLLGAIFYAALGILFLV